MHQEQEGAMITSAFQQLAANTAPANKPLCFVNLPNPIFNAGTAQAVWMYSKTKNPIFQVSSKSCVTGQIQAMKPVFVTWNDVTKQFIKG